MQYNVFLEQQVFRVMTITAFTTHAQGHIMRVFCRVLKTS